MGAVRARRILVGIVLLAAGLVPTGAGGTAPAAAAVGDSLGWYLRDDTSGGAPSRTASFGWNECTPVVGDWDGDGDDSVGVRRSNLFLLRNAPGGGSADLTILYGDPGDRVVTGDWDSDGDDTVAVVRAARWFARDAAGSGPADRIFVYGDAGDLPTRADMAGPVGDGPVVVR
jgi:hypothetical protein